MQILDPAEFPALSIEDVELHNVAAIQEKMARASEIINRLVPLRDEAASLVTSADHAHELAKMERDVARRERVEPGARCDRERAVVDRKHDLVAAKELVQKLARHASALDSQLIVMQSTLKSMRA